MKYLCITLSCILLVGCFSKPENSVRDEIDKRISWQKTDEYKSCISDEKAAVAANKEEWAEYKIKLAKSKAEYPKKIKEYEKAMKDYKLNGGIMPIVDPIPELDVGPGPRLVSQGKCFNPPKGFIAPN